MLLILYDNVRFFFLDKKSTIQSVLSCFFHFLKVSQFSPCFVWSFIHYICKYLFHILPVMNVCFVGEGEITAHCMYIFTQICSPLIYLIDYSLWILQLPMFILKCSLMICNLFYEFDGKKWKMVVYH